MFNKLNIKFSSYSERLKILGIESLEYRRIKFDLVLMYKIYHNLIHINFDTFFTKNRLNYHLRRHSCIIKNTKVPRTRIRNHFFCHRVTKLWNKLPNNVVKSENLETFKNQLNEINLSDLCTLTFQWHLIFFSSCFVHICAAFDNCVDFLVYITLFDIYYIHKDCCYPYSNVLQSLFC